MKTHFITFGAGGDNYYDAINRLGKQAHNINIFNYISIYTDIYLKNDIEFWKKHDKFIENNVRGYGYMIWKPYIIKKTMENMHDGDILLYLDCGCEIDIHKRDIINYYFELVKNSYIIDTSTFLEEKAFTKMDLSIFLNMVDDKYLDSEQRQTGAILFLVCDKTRKLVNEWYDVMCNYNLIDDSPSVNANSVCFVEHRHDQSVYSLLLKKHDLFNTQQTLFNCIEYSRNRTGIARFYV